MLTNMRRKMTAAAVLVLMMLAGGGCTWGQTLWWDEVHGLEPGTTNHLIYEAHGENMQAEGHRHPWEAPAIDQVWYDLRECEAPDWAGGWSANTGNGYYGGLQFDLPTWQSVGGSGYPHEHSALEQVRRAEILRDRRGGYSAWPTCAAKLGLPR